MKTSIIKEEIIKSEISKLRSMLEKKATIKDNLVKKGYFFCSGPNLVLQNVGNFFRVGGRGI